MGRLVSYFARFLALSFTFRFRFPKSWCKYAGLNFKFQTGVGNKMKLFCTQFISSVFVLKLFYSFRRDVKLR